MTITLWKKTLPIREVQVKMTKLDKETLEAGNKYPCALGYSIWDYRQVSNIRRTEFQHLKDSHTVLWLSLPNPLKQDVKSRMKM